MRLNKLFSTNQKNIFSASLKISLLSNLIKSEKFYCSSHSESLFKLSYKRLLIKENSFKMEKVQDIKDKEMVECLKENQKDQKEKKQKKPKEDNSNLKEKYQREKLENVLKRRFFVVQAFEIYGGESGLFDYGPPGCALKQNIEQYWREHFILEDNMLELGCTNLTPFKVFEASGHVDKFTDFMVKDEKTGAFYRADKIIQEHIEKTFEKDAGKNKLKPDLIEEMKTINVQIQNYKEKELDEVIKKLNVKSPEGNPLGPSSEFNLMFGTQIGPDKGSRGFLRPETAQGQFVNFKRLLEYNGGKLPFSSATVGLGFRNEISPRSGLLRVREFALAEIEHFIDPQNKNHKKFDTIKDLIVPLWTGENQMSGLGVVNQTIGEAVEKNYINNQTLAYFMARTFQFLVQVGCNPNGIRFRQHLKNEMAHYASDCWDAEVETSYGWIEVVGHADRTCFDLLSHAKHSKVDQFASRSLKEPIIEKKIKLESNKSELYQIYKDKMKLITEAMDIISNDEEVLEAYCKQFEEKDKTVLKLSNNEELEISKNLISFKRYEEKKTQEKFIPGVIEPAFGIGRIVYCVMEHCFRIREEDTKRTYFEFPPLVSPYKVSLLPLIYSDEMNKFIEPIRKSLVANGISYKIDDIAEGIGKRYARTDELGIPFACTIDEKTIQDGTVTLRECSSTKQVRLPISKLADEIKACSLLQRTWKDIVKEYPEV